MGSQSIISLNISLFLTCFFFTFITLQLYLIICLICIFTLTHLKSAVSIFCLNTVALNLCLYHANILCLSFLYFSFSSMNILIIICIFYRFILLRIFFLLFSVGIQSKIALIYIFLYALLLIIRTAKAAFSPSITKVNITRRNRIFIIIIQSRGSSRINSILIDLYRLLLHLLILTTF